MKKDDGVYNMFPNCLTMYMHTLKGYDYGSLSYFIIVKNKLVNKIEKKLGRNIV